MFDETKHILIGFGRHCYCQVYNSCSKCPSFARTHAQRRLCQSSTALPVMLWSIHNVPNIQQTLLHYVNAVQLQLMHSLLDVTPHLVIDWIKVSAIRRPQICRNKSGCWLLKKSQCRVPSVQVCCLVVRWRNRLTRRASQATAVIGPYGSNSRHWSSPPYQQRWGVWGQALRSWRTP